MDLTTLGFLLSPAGAIILFIVAALSLLVFGAVTLIYPGLDHFSFHGGAGGLCVRLVDVDGTSSYTTGGTSITAASLGFRKIAFAYAMAANDSSHHCQVAGIGKKMQTSIKLMWFVASTGAELAAAQNVSSKATKLMVVGVAC